MPETSPIKAYVSKKQRITITLLVAWFVVSFVVMFFARELTFNFFGWPFSFWVSAQGALVVYLLVIWGYAHYMNMLDAEYGVEETEGE